MKTDRDRVHYVVQSHRAQTQGQGHPAGPLPDRQGAMDTEEDREVTAEVWIGVPVAREVVEGIEIGEAIPGVGPGA